MHSKWLHQIRKTALKLIQPQNDLLRWQNLQKRWLAVATASKETDKIAKIGEIQSYVHGASQIPLLHDTIDSALHRAADAQPDKVVFTFSNYDMDETTVKPFKVTYSQFISDVKLCASGLIELGLQPGDRVGMWGPNSYEWVLTQFATAIAGFILVNINPAYQSNELQFALEKVGVKALIASPSFKTTDYYRILVGIIPEIANARLGEGAVKSHELPEFKHLIMIGDHAHHGAWNFKTISESAGTSSINTLEQLRQNVEPDDPVNIQYTSGTTGYPKGATLTHHNIVNNAFFSGRRCGFPEKDSKLCMPAPLYHCLGCVLGSLTTIVHQSSCVFPASSFNSFAALKAIQIEKCTIASGTPTMFIDMLNHSKFAEFDLSSLKFGFIAGAPCPIELCKRLVEDMHMTGLTPGYGSTETSPASFVAIQGESPEQRIKSVGHILDHVEAKVVDENGKTVARGQNGELLTRGYLIMHGYWNDEDRSREIVTSDRWYHTGDIARMNTDGTVNIIGRCKDMIIRGGENIYPAEIESFLYEHPKVEDVHVIGVPDERMGEEICAWIRLHASATNDITEQTIRDYCKGKISHFKIPRYILFKKEYDFPLTVTGKVQKFKLREISKQELGLTQVKSHFNQ